MHCGCWMQCAGSAACNRTTSRHSFPPHGNLPSLAGRRGELELLDWGMSNATLEEVFVRITREAGVKLSAFA